MQYNNVLAMDSEIKTENNINSVTNNMDELSTNDKNNMIVNGYDFSKVPDKELVQSTLKVLKQHRLKFLAVLSNGDEELQTKYDTCYENLNSFINNIQNLQNIMNKLDENNIKQFNTILRRNISLCMNMNEIART